MIARLDYHEHNPKATTGLAALGKHLDSIDKKLKALVEVRASQINGCAFCLDMHAQDAREAGETQQRLDCLAGWRECSFFDEAERAALAWTEALTAVSQSHAPAAPFEALKAHFSDRQIVDLTLAVSIINAWNRLAVGLGRQPDPRD
jgi:AhpD family alkylhydroperoxidase